MFTLLIVLHVIFCVFLILVILLQTGKGAGIGAAFGGGSQTVFGPRGAGSFIGKLTGIVAALFMLTSLTLAYLSSSGSSGVADKAGALNDEQPTEVEEVSLEKTTQEAEEAPAEGSSDKPAAGKADASPDKAATNADAGKGQPKPADTQKEIKKEQAAAPVPPGLGDKPKTAPQGLDSKVKAPPGLKVKPLAKGAKKASGAAKETKVDKPRPAVKSQPADKKSADKEPIEKKPVDERPAKAPIENKAIDKPKSDNSKPQVKKEPSEKSAAGEPAASDNKPTPQ